MSDISEKAIKLIKDLRRDISIDIMFTPEKNAEDDSLKALVDYIAELEHRNKVLEDACEMLRKENGRVTQLLDFWKGLSTNGSKVQESEATACKFCGSNESDRRMNSIVCSGCGRKIGNVAPPEVQE